VLEAVTRVAINDVVVTDLRTGQDEDDIPF
jgi:hypothetical protein